MGLSPEGVNAILSAVDFERWVNKAELAPVPLDFTTPESDEAAALARAYVALNGTGSPDNKDDYFTFYSNLKVVFHDTLQEEKDSLNQAILERIDADYNCTGDIDPEVKQRWYPTGLSLFYDPVYDPAHEWISSMGRSKYLSPVYASLEDSGQHDLGVQWYDENKDFYHPVAATTVSEILGIEQAKAPSSVNPAMQEILVQA